MNDAERTIAAIFRIVLPKLVAGGARMPRDVGRAEELAQDAMVIALERWPTASAMPALRSIVTATRMDRS